MSQAGGSPETDESLRPSALGWAASLQKLAWFLLSAAAATGSALGIHWFACSSPHFALQRVQVVGLSRLTRVEGLALAGARVGENLLSIDVAAAERSLVAHPWVRAARVSRRLPNALRIEVTEYSAQALAQLGGCLFLVDRGGRAFKRWAAADPTDLPVVTGIDAVALVRDRERSQGLLRRGVAWLEAYRRSELGREWPVQQLHFDDHRALIAHIGERAIPLYWGALGSESAPFVGRLGRISAALRELSASDSEAQQDPIWLAEGPSASLLQALDARAPDRVVVRF